MNVHHLELFYYVAKHGGISEAVRNMPYGIQQPAISGQVIQLEEFLGTALFQRRPFALTPAGQELYAFIKPFFENLDSAAESIRGGVAQNIRIAASEIVLRDHLPRILQQLKQQFPRLKVTLRTAYQPRIMALLERQEIDLTITLLWKELPAGINVVPLFKLPLVLLVPRKSRLRSARELWEQDRIEAALITIPGGDPITRVFQEGLFKLKVDWFTSIEVGTVELVETFVAHGYGIGVTVRVPKMKFHPQVRALPLEGFEPVTFGVLWQGRRTPVLDALLSLVEAAARTLHEGEDQGLLLLR